MHKNKTKHYWVARDKTSHVCAFLTHPVPTNGVWFPQSNKEDYYLIPRHSEYVFEDLTFENSPKLIIIEEDD